MSKHRKYWKNQIDNPKLEDQAVRDKNNNKRITRNEALKKMIKELQDVVDDLEKYNDELEKYINDL